jgi:hypothetical protein
MSTERLAAAADQLEIIAVLVRYCHALDRRDQALLASCFHPDSTHRHGGFDGLSADFLGFAHNVLVNLDMTHHHLSAPLIRLEGDVAHVESYFTATHRIPAVTPEGAAFVGNGAPQDLVIGGRYVDRFERCSGVWLIAHRIGVHDWQRQTDAAENGFSLLPIEQRGRHGPDDPAWHVPPRP